MAIDPPVEFTPRSARTPIAIPEGASVRRLRTASSAYGGINWTLLPVQTHR